MITEEDKQKSAAERIRILREGYGDSNDEVRAWDEAHPGDIETVEPTDRLTTEEVAVAEETVPASPRARKSSSEVLP